MEPLKALMYSWTSSISSPLMGPSLAAFGRPSGCLAFLSNRTATKLTPQFAQDTSTVQCPSASFSSLTWQSASACEQARHLQYFARPFINAIKFTAFHYKRHLGAPPSARIESHLNRAADRCGWVGRGVSSRHSRPAERNRHRSDQRRSRDSPTLGKNSRSEDPPPGAHVRAGYPAGIRCRGFRIQPRCSECPALENCRATSARGR